MKEYYLYIGFRGGAGEQEKPVHKVSYHKIILKRIRYTIGSTKTGNSFT